MSRILAIILLALCAGCFSSSRPESKRWTVEPPSVPPSELGPEKPPAAFGMTRVGTVVVNAPFDKTPLVVRRADGSVAFDAYNEFAAAPSSLLRAPVHKMLSADGRFGHVVSPSSAASADASVEIMVTDLSLDCRESGKRTARAAVCVDVVKTGRGPRTVALSADGASEADAASGDFSAAFSKAFNEAFAEALKLLK